MALTGEQVREACELLRWSRFDLQRRTAMPLAAVDRTLASRGSLGGTLSEEIVLRDAFHRADIDFTPEGPRRRGRSA